MEKVHNLERLNDIAMGVMHVTGLVDIELPANYALTIGYSLCECKFVWPFIYLRYFVVCNDFSMPTLFYRKTQRTFES